MSCFPKNEARNAEIIRLRKSGIWPRDIAKQMGLTKNVVIGVCFRAGLGDYQGALQQRPKGERHYKAKLTEEDVREIRRRSGESYVSLAAEFGVSSSHISHIVSGYSWAWVA